MTIGVPERRVQRVILGALVAGAIVLLIQPRPPDGRAEAGGSVTGVVALIDADAPKDNIYNGQFCGGVLVAPDEILTAAHCVADRAQAIDAVLGADNLCQGTPIDGVRIPVERVVIHPDFDAVSGQFDLAMLVLSRNAASSPPRLIAPPSAVLSRAIAMGWGTASSGGIPSCRLMRVALQILDPSECATSLVGGEGRAFDPRSMICASPAASDGSDTCSGDSGGPLILGTEASRGPIVGIVSWGRGCGSGPAGVYARADAWHQLTQADRD